MRWLDFAGYRGDTRNVHGSTGIIEASRPCRVGSTGLSDLSFSLSFRVGLPGMVKARGLAPL